MVARGDRLETLPAALAAGVPLAAYLATASGHGYWLDGGELVAQATDFGISHPPGHPLAGVVHGAVALIPLGPLPFRVAIASALLAATAALFLHRAATSTYRSLGLAEKLAAPLGVGTTWWVAASFGWWFQAVRPEVYALQAALLAFALERLARFEERYPEVVDARPLHQAALALGFALANHHFLAFLVLPAAAGSVARVVRAHGGRVVLRSALFVGVGLLSYVYLPLRAASDATLRLGEPNGLSRLWWVVSAQAFQKNTGAGVPEPMGERFGDIVMHLASDLHLGVLVLALAGIYALLRTRGSRRIAGVWLLVLLFFVGARGWLGFVRHNPDALGYLMPASAAIGVFAGGLIAALLRLLGEARWVVALAWILALASGWQVARTGPEASLAGFHDTDTLDDPLRRELPPRAIVLSYVPQTVFAWWGAESVEHTRPDLTMVPMPFLSYPGLVEDLVAEEERLEPLLRDLVIDGEVRLPALQTLALERPVLVELDLRYPPSLYETLAPEGLYHRVLSDGGTETDRALGAQSELARFRSLYSRIERPDDRVTREILLWRHYQDALYHAALGDRVHARAAVAWGLKLEPEEPMLRGLEQALSERDDEGELLEGPLEVTRFRVDAP